MHILESQRVYTKMAKDNGLLIAGLVAIVAIVGLVILLSGASASGALYAPGQVDCPRGYTLQHFVGSHGNMASYVCAKPAPDMYNVRNF